MKITIDNDGLIDYGDASSFERNVAEGVANYINTIGPYDRGKWIDLAERVIMEMRKHSKQVKSSIEADFDVDFHKVSSESSVIKNMPQARRNGYLEGYSAAMDESAGIFEQLNIRLERVLNDHLKTTDYDTTTNS